MSRQFRQTPLIGRPDRRACQDQSLCKLLVNTGKGFGESKRSVLNVQQFSASLRWCPSRSSPSKIGVTAKNENPERNLPPSKSFTSTRREERDAYKAYKVESKRTQMQFCTVTLFNGVRCLLFYFNLYYSARAGVASLTFHASLLCIFLYLCVFGIRMCCMYLYLQELQEQERHLWRHFMALCCESAAHAWLL